MCRTRSLRMSAAILRLSSVAERGAAHSLSYVYESRGAAHGMPSLQRSLGSSEKLNKTNTHEYTLSTRMMQLKQWAVI